MSTNSGACHPRLVGEFQLAGSLGDAERAREVLREGLDPNCRLADGTALLINTISDGHARLVRPLLEAGASAHVVDTFGNSAIAYALLKPTSPTWEEAIAALRQAGATDAGTSQGRFVLACTRGAKEEAVAWLAKGATVNGYGPGQTFGLGLAAQNGRVETVRALIGQGADPNLAGLGGWTALMAAALMGHLEVVKLLVEAGADPGVRRVGGSTAKGYAVEGRHHEVAAYLEGTATRRPRESDYAGRRGADGFGVGCTVALIRGAARDVCEAFARTTGGAVDSDVLGKRLRLGARSYLVMQFTGHQWSVISGLTRGTLLDPLETWAEEISRSLGTEAIHFDGARDDGDIAYGWFVRGERVETLAGGEIRSRGRRVRAVRDVRRAADAFIRERGAYVPGYETARIDDGAQVTLDWPDVASGDVAGAYCVTLPPVGE